MENSQDAKRIVWDDAFTRFLYSNPASKRAVDFLSKYCHANYLSGYNNEPYTPYDDDPEGNALAKIVYDEGRLDAGYITKAETYGILIYIAGRNFEEYIDCATFTEASQIAAYAAEAFGAESIQVYRPTMPRSNSETSDSKPLLKIIK